MTNLTRRSRNVLGAIVVLCICVVLIYYLICLESDIESDGPIEGGMNVGRGELSDNNASIHIVQDNENEVTVRERLETSGNHLEVEVLKKKTGKPAAHSVIEYLDRARIDSKRLFHVQGDLADPSVAIQELGTAVVADEDGRATIPRGSRKLSIKASWNDLVGYYLGPYPDETMHSETVRIYVSSPRRLCVNVIEPDGSPAPGLPVAVRKEKKRLSVDIVRGISNQSDGRALLEYNESLLDSYSGPTRIALDFPLKKAVEIGIDPNRTADCYQLVSPERGTLRVVLVPSSDGTSDSLLQDVVVKLLPDPSVGEMPHYHWYDGVPAGYAEFLFYPFGLEVRYTLAVLHNGVTLCKTNGIGPRLPQEEKVVSITIPSQRQFSITAVALDGTGTLLTQERIRVIGPVVGLYSNGGPDTVVATDEKGRLELRLMVDRFPTTVTFVQISTGTTAELVIESTPHNDPLDVGNVTFEKRGILVSGQVCDDLGIVAGATVTVSSHNRKEQMENYIVGVSDETGHFEVYGGSSFGKEVSVEITKEGYCEVEEKDVPVGAKNLIFRLVRGGTLTGNIRFDGGLFPEDVKLLLQPLSASESARLKKNYWKVAYPDSEGQFRWTGIKPGLGTVSILRRKWRKDPLMVIDNVIIKAGVKSTDPRLKDIDLSQSVSVITLRVTDGIGKPLTDGTIHLLWGEDCVTESMHEQRTDVFGAARVLVADKLMDVLIQVPGYQPAYLPRLDEDRDVVLEPSPVVRFRLSGFDTLATEKVSTVLEIRAVSCESINPLADESHITTVLSLLPCTRVPILTPREAMTRLPMVGEYEVQLLVRGMDRNGSVCEVTLPRTMHFKILHSQDEQLVNLDTDEEYLKRSLRHYGLGSQ